MLRRGTSQNPAMHSGDRASFDPPPDFRCRFHFLRKSRGPLFPLHSLVARSPSREPGSPQLWSRRAVGGSSRLEAGPVGAGRGLRGAGGQRGPAAGRARESAAEAGGCAAVTAGRAPLPRPQPRPPVVRLRPARSRRARTPLPPSWGAGGPIALDVVSDRSGLAHRALWSGWGGERRAVTSLGAAPHEVAGSAPCPLPTSVVGPPRPRTL